MNTNTLEYIKQQIKKSAGKISTVNYKKNIQPKKSIVKKYGEIGNITKKSTFQVRTGIDYENIKTVKEAHQNGETQRKGLPPSMEKIQTGIYHHIHKDLYYIGCAPVHNKLSINESHYFIDDKEYKLDDIIINKSVDEQLTLSDIIYAKDQKNHDSEWIQLEWNNIVSLSSIK